MRFRDGVIITASSIFVTVIFILTSSSPETVPISSLQSEGRQDPTAPPSHSSSVVSTTTTVIATPSIIAPSLSSLPSHRFITRLQTALNSWSVSCLDAKNKRNPLSWRRGLMNRDDTACPFQFKNYLDSKADEAVFSAVEESPVEAHGDSTLRELIKFFISRVGVKEATLEKKDANMTMRRPRVFSRTADGRNRAMHLAFRFDFVGEHILEHPGPMASSSSSSSPSPLLLVSIGSHIAKQFAMVDRKMARPFTNAERNAYTGVIRRSVVEPLQQLLIQRFARRDNSASAPPPPSLLLFTMQSLECRAMGESSIRGFRDMAPSCPAMEQFLDDANAMIVKEVADVVQSADVGEMRRRAGCPSSLSPLCLSDDAELERMRGRFLYLGPSRCSDSAFDAARGSHRHCTRDGIHFRSRFIKIRVDAVLNVLIAWRRPEAH